MQSMASKTLSQLASYILHTQVIVGVETFVIKLPI